MSRVAVLGTGSWGTAFSMVLADAGADLLTALTMTNSNEAIGVARAAQQLAIPVVISFTVETDGNLPTGETLGDAIAQVDAATDSYPAYFMVNCAHPTHFEKPLLAGGAWVERLRGVRANASRCSRSVWRPRRSFAPGSTTGRRTVPRAGVRVSPC